VKAVIAKSFARIHAANLINAGILPLTFENADDYDKVALGDKLSIKGIRNAVSGNKAIVLDTENGSFKLRADLSERDRDIILAGGLLEFTKGAR
ncbi:MAG: aconitate hydratase, partial [Clostridiales bacterium]|nr:aconitate hydratase [Candidatus Coliplasma equi]